MSDPNSFFNKKIHNPLYLWTFVKCHFGLHVVRILKKYIWAKSKLFTNHLHLTFLQGSLVCSGKSPFVLSMETYNIINT